MEPAVSVVGLTKRFPKLRSYRELFRNPLRKKEITALEGVDLDIREGERFGLLGPNGAGKTTLIKILCTLVSPTAGKAFVGGYDVSLHGKEIRKRIGYVVSDERSFYWRLTGRQNLRFFAALNGLHGGVAEARIRELTSLLGLEESIDRMFQDCSSGMKQKLAIARGLLADPRILILDEPTRTLDPLAADGMRRFLKEFAAAGRGRTVVLATHNTAEAQELCDRVAILAGGKIVRADTPEGLRRSLDGKGRYAIRLAGSHASLRERVPELRPEGAVLTVLTDASRNGGALVRAEIDPDRTTISDVVERIVRAGLKVEGVRPEEASLQDAYAAILGGDDALH